MSSLLSAKSQLLSLLEAELGSNVAVLRIPPVSPEDLTGDDGSLEAVWIERADTTADSPVIGTPMAQFQEIVDLRLICQALGPESTAEEVDTAADRLFDGVMETVISDPRLGVTSFLFEVYEADWAYISGRLPAGEGYGARFEVTLRYRARPYTSVT